MNNDWFKPLLLGAIIFLLIMGFLMYRVQTLQDDKDGLTSALSEKQDSIHYHKTESGRIRSEKLAAEMRAKDVEKAYPEIAETLKREFNTEIKNLRAYIKNEFAAKGEGVGTTTNNFFYDSAKHRLVYYRDFKMDDGYLNFNARVYDSLAQSPYQYIYRDTAETVIATKKKWFLGNESLYASTIFRNPNNKTTNTKNILIKTHRDKRWNVSVGGYLDPIRMRMGPSINVGYSLIKF